MTAEPRAAVAVIGGGQGALLAAIALARTAPGAPIRLVETPVDPAALADTTRLLPPALLRLHERLGIDEAGLIRRAAASHWLATRYDGFGPRPFTIGFGAPPRLDLDADAPGLAAMLATAQRFRPAADDPADPLADLDHGLRIASGGYRRHLGSLARHLGIASVAGSVAAVERTAAGDVAAVRLTGGDVIEASLFIDAAGPAAAILGGRRLAWADRLPFDRLAVAAPGPPSLDLADGALARDGACLLRSPGRDGAHVRVAWRDGGEAAAHALLDVTGAVPVAETRLLPGRAEAAWRGNVVAIGDAAATIGPVGGMALHLVARQIALLVETLPAPSPAPAVRREFNRRAALIAETAADYVAAHHAREETARSADLDRTLDLYRRRGHLARWGEDAMPRDLWRQLLAGTLGVHRDAPAEALPTAERSRLAAAAARGVAAGVAAAPPYRSWLAALLERVR